jgi:beta-glucosidase
LQIGSSSDDIRWKKIVNVGGIPVNKSMVEVPVSRPAQGNSERQTEKLVTVLGVVRDVQATVLSGVHVSIKNSDSFVTTGGDGTYSIKAMIGNVLVFSAKGYVTQEFQINNNDILNVKLVPMQTD